MKSGHEKALEGSNLSLESRMGLKLLMQAYTCAEEVGRDVWDFAVEIPILLSAGFSLSEVRWLVCKGYASHARETTTVG